MPHVTAPTNYEELEKALANDDKVQLTGVDIDGVLRGKIMIKSKFLSSVKGGGFGFCSVIFGWDMHDQAYSTELSISNMENGYKDILARIDLDTYRRTPHEPSLPFFMITYIDPDTGEPLFACPRALLAAMVNKTSKLGLTALGGCEYEYFNFSETPKTAAAKKYRDLVAMTDGNHGYSLLRPSLNSEYFYELYDACQRFDIPIEGHHTETGPGVYESALVYQPVSRMADNATLFKWVAKTVGYKHNVMPTFMAKPYSDQPGCSGHIHVSLVDKNGKNVFAVEENEIVDGRADAAFEDTKRVSKVAEHFIAGLLAGLADIVPCLIPTVNGYKRLVETYWAPVHESYAYESRAASIRIISPPVGDAKGTRLEVRVPGADVNAYLALSAILACGLYGMENKLELTQPPLDLKSGDKPVRLPRNLGDAATRMARKDSMARKVLGDKFVDHYTSTRLNEWQIYSSTVTDWELARYFELA